MDYIESPIADIINKYITAIIPKARFKDIRVAVSKGYIFIISLDTVIYRVFAKELDQELTFGFLAEEQVEVPGDKYKLNYKKTKMDIALCEATLKSVDIEKNLLGKIENARVSDEEFEKIIGIKAEDGCAFYRLIGFDGRPYFIPIFSSFPSLAKADDIDIYVYKSIKDEDSYIIRETIHKKKIKSDYDVFFRTLKFS